MEPRAEISFVSSMKIGSWVYSIKNVASTDQSITVAVTSRPSNSSMPPIEVQPYLELTDVTAIVSTTIYAQVKYIIYLIIYFFPTHFSIIIFNMSQVGVAPIANDGLVQNGRWAGHSRSTNCRYLSLCRRE